MNDLKYDHDKKHCVIDQNIYVLRQTYTHFYVNIFMFIYKENRVRKMIPSISYLSVWESVYAAE